MSHEQSQTPTVDEGLRPEALSNEILKLKIDDLFQEIETLKKRVERLEGKPKQAADVVSNPDRFPGSIR